MDNRRQRTMNNPGIMGALTPSDGRNMGRQNLPFHSTQSMNRVTGAVERPQSFTNLNMLGRPDLAFRYSNMDPGRTSYDLFDTPGNPSQDASIRGTYRRTQTGRTVADRDPRANEMDEYGYLEGAPRQRTTFSEGYMNPRSFDEMYGGVYDDAIFRTVDPNTNRIEQFPMARGMEQAAVDPSDWRNILRILEAGGDPQTETAGIMGAMPEERQMAELTDDQRNFMRNRYFSPDLPGAPTQDELFRRVKDREKKPLFGIFGGQEPTTREEFDDYYNNLMDNFYVT